MKRIILLISVIAFTCLANIDQAMANIESQKQVHRTPNRDSVISLSGNYYKNSTTVYYKSQVVVGASPESFKFIGNRYAKDAHRVYYAGEQIDGASPKSFKEVGGDYGKDNFNVYFQGQRVEGASAATFKYSGQGYFGNDKYYSYDRGMIISSHGSSNDHNYDGHEYNRYHKDSWNVYYGNTKVADAVSSSFTYLGGDYGKDNWSVFYRGVKVEDAVSSSFTHLGGNYGKDKWTVFYRGIKVEGAVSSSFEYVGNGIGKDRWNEYYQGTQRPNSGSMHGSTNPGINGRGYNSDTWNVYYNGVKIEGANNYTFKDLGGGYAKDAWSVYYRGIKIEGAASTSFEYIGDGFARDAWNTYDRGSVKSNSSPTAPGTHNKRGYSVDFHHSRIWVEVTVKIAGMCTIVVLKSREHLALHLNTWEMDVPLTAGMYTTKGLRQNRKLGSKRS